jgi:hypothetical protein
MPEAFIYCQKHLSIRLGLVAALAQIREPAPRQKIAVLAGNDTAATRVEEALLAPGGACLGDGALEWQHSNQ